MLLLLPASMALRGVFVMPDPWLDIIGIGEDGEAGLSEEALHVLTQAEVIVGGDRHLNLTSNRTAERVSWPSPFDAMIERLLSYRGKRIVVLVTGDPLWYSVGARITKSIPASEIRFYPQLSAFQLAACRMGWSLADLETVTVHGRAASQILPHLGPGVRLLVLTKDRTSPSTIAALMCDRGYGESSFSVLAAMGGKQEQRFDGTASNWDLSVPDFHVLAIECRHDGITPIYGWTGGIPDDAFVHDGKMTKQEVRAITLTKLCPYPDAFLWDVGAGCGSIAIEWMRAARGAMAVAIEPLESRCAMIQQNAEMLGVEKIRIVQNEAPTGFGGLEVPDAVFIGGGLTSTGVVSTAWDALRPGGRMVANAVTIEGGKVLTSICESHGGELAQIGVSRAVPVGQFKGWKPLMPVMQWCAVKPMEHQNDW